VYWCSGLIVSKEDVLTQCIESVRYLISLFDDLVVNGLDYLI